MLHTIAPGIGAKNAEEAIELLSAEGANEVLCPCIICGRVEDCPFQDASSVKAEAPHFRLPPGPCDHYIADDTEQGMQRLINVLKSRVQ